MTIAPLFLARLLFAAIPLIGVTGERLRSRAFFDINNAKVGDPLVLTIDFIGEADFASLHPPKISQHVDRRDWKVDDDSAKTETVDGARRLTYRVRPMREGVLWFPSLSFSFATGGGETKVCHANAVPVHAKKGESVVVKGMEEDLKKIPDPDALITDVELDDDDLAFAWQKACAKPTADAFAEFDFPEAKMNEARCAMLEGDFRRALRIYSRLEWSVGQTPAIERGIVAALARRFENPLVELPVWRQVGRPVLRYGWRGRAGIVLGGILAVVLVFLLLGKIVRSLAAIAFVALLALPGAAFAQSRQRQDPFAAIEAMQRQMHQQMQQMMNMPFGGGGMRLTFDEAERVKVDVKTTLSVDRKSPQVGETFHFIVGIEAPKKCNVSGVMMTPSNQFGMKVVGDVENLADEPSDNPTNVIHRMSVPVRYDVPFRDPITFVVEGTVSGRVTVKGGNQNMIYNFSKGFKSRTAPLDIDVKPLPAANQPEDFSGLVASVVKVDERLDASVVGTNDVICITYILSHDGFLPESWMPQGSAFEMQRGRDNGRETVLWRRFFVADGTNATPKVEFSYYIPSAKRYRRLTIGGTNVGYR